MTPILAGAPRLGGSRPLRYRGRFVGTSGLLIELVLNVRRLLRTRSE
jgi:hypothetical protein